MEFSISKMKECIKQETDKRVSKSSTKELDADLQTHGKAISQKAIEYAEADDRITVREKDIRNALQHFHS